MLGQDPTMSAISAVSPIPSVVTTTPVAPIRPIAPSPGRQTDGGGGSARPQAANPSGVGRLLDIKA
jgi:hypothetical protein